MKLKNQPPARLVLETLEARWTPTVTLTINNSLWIAAAGNNPETVSLRNININGVDHVEITENGVVSQYKTSQLSGGFVFFYGSTAANSFTNKSTLKVVAYGGPAADYFYSSTPSFVYGQGGNNTIDCSAATGTCVIYAGDGNDNVKTGSGNDFIYGGFGNDTLSGGAGIDVMNGGEGNNTIDGGLGADLLFGGGSGDNTIYAGPVEDTTSNQIIGGTGNNTLYGASGGDMIWAAGSVGKTAKVYGGAGNDHLFGGPGTNYLYGEAGSDFLIGANGSNYLSGGAGVDYLYGGSGANDLDGGIDGSQDFLVGGTGRNRFRRELFGSPAFTSNRDLIYNYTSSTDTLYI